MEVDIAKAGLHMLIEKPISMRPAEEVERLAQVSLFPQSGMHLHTDTVLLVIQFCSRLVCSNVHTHIPCTRSHVLLFQLVYTSHSVSITYTLIDSVHVYTGIGSSGR